MIRNVLCLHGMGQTKRSLKTILTHVERNTTANFHYIEAPYKMPGCPGFRWFDRDANYQTKHEQISCSIDLISEYSLRYGIDTLFGFSQGGMMVNLALMFSSDVLHSVDRAIIMSGYLSVSPPICSPYFSIIKPTTSEVVSEDSVPVTSSEMADMDKTTSFILSSLIVKRSSVAAALTADSCTICAFSRREAYSSAKKDDCHLVAVFRMSLTTRLFSEAPRTTDFISLS